MPATPKPETEPDAPPPTLRARQSSDAQPAPLEGILEKKKSHTAWRDTWHERFFRIDASDCSLKYFKAAGDATPKGSIDLRLVVDVERYSKSDDPLRFSINLGEQNIKLRAKSPASKCAQPR